MAKRQFISKQQKAFFLSWLLNHAHVAISSLGRLVRTPFSSLMTCAVIGIALALPTGLLLILMQINEFSEQWQTASSISLFLKQDLSIEESQQFFNTIQKISGLHQVELISRTQALAEFSQKSDFGEALNLLDQNPLPAVILIQPDTDYLEKSKITLLLSQLNAFPETDFVQLDMQWVARLQSIIQLIKTLILILALLLAMAVLLTIGNTIRLEIQNRKEEIEITKLIGATDAFIQRPFLYFGLLYGIGGGLFAWLILAISFALLIQPIATLADLYQAQFSLTTEAVSTLLIMMLSSILLGLSGAWMAVKRHLQQIQPK